MRTFLAQVQGSTGWLEGDEFHHAIRVDRFREGDEIRVLDGKGGAFIARIQSVDRKKRRAHLEILAPASVPRVSGDVWLAVSVLRPERMRFLVEKATEIGVSRIRFLRFARSTDRNVPHARLERIAWEAVKQCGRALPPELGGPVSFEDFLEDIAGVPVIVLDQKGEASLSPLGSPIWVVVGPEGGFTPEEISQLRKHKAAFLSLGPTVLRAETAALLGAWAVLNPIHPESFRGS